LYQGTQLFILLLENNIPVNIEQL